MKTHCIKICYNLFYLDNLITISLVLTGCSPTPVLCQNQHYAGAVAGAISPDQLKQNYINTCLSKEGYQVIGWSG